MEKKLFSEIAIKKAEAILQEARSSSQMIRNANGVRLDNNLKQIYGAQKFRQENFHNPHGPHNPSQGQVASKPSQFRGPPAWSKASPFQADVRNRGKPVNTISSTLDVDNTFQFLPTETITPDVEIPPGSQNPKMPTEADVKITLAETTISETGARLLKFASTWESAPREIYTTVKRGYHWPWLDQPPKLQLPSNTQNQPQLGPLIQKWIETRVIYKVEKQPCFLSRLFTVPKKDGTLRPILDLSQLNKYIAHIPFRMTNHTTVSKLLKPPVMFASLDLTEAYTHIPIRANLHRYLAFSYKNDLYFFRALPFGLSPAPYIFTKILSWPLSLLHQEGVDVVAYLDDWFLWHQSATHLSNAVSRTTELLQSLGFTINVRKSHLTPTFELEWLGIMWRGQTGEWLMPQPKQQQINKLARRLLHSKTITRRQWEVLLGSINFACQVHSHLRPQFQTLSRVTAIADSSHRDKPVQLPIQLGEPLRFWTSRSIWEVIPQFATNHPKSVLWTDASLKGWGALLNSLTTAQGLWSHEQQNYHINILELLAVSRAIISLNIRKSNLLLYTDNEVVRYSISKNRSKSPTLLKEIKSLVSLCLERDITLSATRIPSILNTVADSLSRTTALPTEWCLPKRVFTQIQKWYGPLTIDLMATPFNAQLQRFISPFPHPLAEDSNVLTLNWNRWNHVYIFPPVKMIPQLLPQLRSYKGHGVFIAPWQPTAAWFPELCKRAKDHLHIREPLVQDVQGQIICSKLSGYERWTAFHF